MQSSLIKIKYNVTLESFNELSTTSALKDLLHDIENIYSYVIFDEYKNYKLVSWTITININENDKYNTIQSNDAITAIVNCIKNNISSSKENKRAIGFGQPSLELMLQLYEPYMKSLARKMNARWKMYEYEDLLSICKMCMCILYKKGYYLNKILLQRVFTNYILMDLRNVRNVPVFVSLDSCDEDGISVMDILSNTLVENNDIDDDDVKNSILNKEKREVINLIGTRAYMELLRQYRCNCTNSYTSKQITSIRSKLLKKNITYLTIKFDVMGE